MGNRISARVVASCHDTAASTNHARSDPPRKGRTRLPYLITPLLICAVLTKDLDSTYEVGCDDNIAMVMHAASEICRTFFWLFGRWRTGRVGILFVLRFGHTEQCDRG